MSEVYYVPDLTNNLLSIGQLQEKNLVITFKAGTCRIFHPKIKIIETKMTTNRMFVVHAKQKSFPRQCLQSQEINLENLWYRRYGHINYKSITTMQKKKMVKGLPTFKDFTGICEVCNYGKQHRDNIPKRSHWRASEKLELVHSDLCGPISPMSNGGKRYLLVFVDDYSRKTWIYCLSEKRETFEIFKCFKNLVEKEAQKAICTLRTDKGGEFTSQQFSQFCMEQGIKRQLTTAFTPFQNGVVERRNRTIMNMVRCLLTEKEMPKTLCAEAAKWTSHVINRSLTTALKEMVPEERWSGIKPKVDYFRIFGFVAYVHIPEQRRTKLDNRSIKCVLLGVSEESKAYRLYDPVMKRIITSRDVIFEEEGKWNWNMNPEQTTQNNLDWGDNETDAEDSDEELISENSKTTAELDAVNPGTETESEKHPRRERRAPGWLLEYESGEGFSEEEQEAAMVFFMSNNDPTSYEEASRDEKWKEAMKREIEVIEKNRTWDLVTLPAHAKNME